MLLNESFGYVLFMLYVGMCALNTCRRSCYICRGPTFQNLSKFLFISRSSDCLSKAYFVMVYPPTTLVLSFRFGSANLILFHCSYVFFSPILNRRRKFSVPCSHTSPISIRFHAKEKQRAEIQMSSPENTKHLWSKSSLTLSCTKFPG